MVKKFLSSIPLSLWDIGWFRGRELNRDIALSCPKTEVRVVFDIGAYVGEESRKFLRAWPDARVFAFEPTPESFAMLERKVRNSRLHAFPLAMSSTAGRARFSVSYLGSSNRISNSSIPGLEAIEIEATSIDQFCKNQSIEKIDILRIDTEGHELEVLSGSGDMLSAGQIGFIRVESGVDPANDRHVPYNELVEFLGRYGYRIFGVYEQHNEFFRSQPQLRRFDLAFIAPKQIELNNGVAIRFPRTLLDSLVSLKNRLV